MEENKPTNNNEIQVELSEEMAQGIYANLAIIAHSPSEFILDFIRVVPGAPKAQVKSRIIMTPDNAHRLYLALQDNLRKYEAMLANARTAAPANNEGGAGEGKTANFQDFVPKGDA